MSDDDLIRRGDALNAVLTTDFRHEAHDAIAALPAVTALTPKPVDDSLAADPAVKEWNAAIEAAAKALIPKRLKSVPSEYEKGYNDGLGDAFDAILALLKEEKT